MRVQFYVRDPDNPLMLRIEEIEWQDWRCSCGELWSEALNTHQPILCPSKTACPEYRRLRYEQLR